MKELNYIFEGCKTSAEMLCTVVVILGMLCLFPAIVASATGDFYAVALSVVFEIEGLKQIVKLCKFSDKAEAEEAEK